MGIKLKWGSLGRVQGYDLIANLTTDYGADPTGVAIAQSSFLAMKAAAQGKRALISSAAGTYNIGTLPTLIQGIGDITFINTGSTWTNGFNFQTNHIAQKGIDDVNGKSARIQTVSPGATSVTLTAASASAGHISRFSVGQFMLVCGWSIQGQWLAPYSFPPNWAVFEFRQITSIVSNTLSFSQPLDFYYSSAWPEINRGDAFEVDAAGPASIFAIDLGWNGTTTVNDGTYNMGDLINCYRENFVMNGGQCTGLPIYPSVTNSYKVINHTATAALTEHDKLCTLVDLQGGSYAQWKCQSSSTHLLKMTGTTLTSLNGTPENTILDGCTITTNGAMKIGPIAYGRNADTFVAKNSSFAGVPDPSAFLEKGFKRGVTDPGVQGYMFMSSGVITIPMSMGDGACRSLVPDSSGNQVRFWEGNSGTVGSFKVLSATSDSWPAVDDQTATVACTINARSYSLSVGTPTFSPGDVGKCIILPGMSNLAIAGVNCTITNASPGVFTYVPGNHQFPANFPIRFAANSGTLPSQIVAGTTYYVSATGLTTNTFQVSATPGGASINTSGGSGTVGCTNRGSDLNTFISGFTDSQNVTLYDYYDAPSGFDMSSVSRSIRWGTCNMYITTDQAGGLPNAGLYPNGKLNIRLPAARSVRFENCVGTGTSAQQATIADLSQSAAWDRPIYSYSKRTYDGTTGTSGAPSVNIQGKLVSIKVNVTKAYTGAGTLNMGFSPFNNQKMVTGPSASSYGSYGPRFNLKIAGERVITPGSTTGTQSGDSNLDLATAVWFPDLTGCSISRDISAEPSGDWPSFTIEWILDQGF